MSVRDDLVYGVNPARESLSGEFRKPRELFLAEGDRSERLRGLAAEAERNGVRIRWRERRELDRLVGHSHHQGVVLVVEPFGFAALEDVLTKWRESGERALFLALDSITDPHNLGALLRSAEAAGCQGVLVPKDRSCSVTPTVDRASAGALAHIPLCRVTNLSRALEDLKKEGIWVYGLAGEDDSSSLYEIDLSGNICLVVGSEGGGLRPNIRSHCDGLVSIPMLGTVSSLNASVAGGVALFEAVRQRSAARRGGPRSSSE